MQHGSRRRDVAEKTRRRGELVAAQRRHRREKRCRSRVQRRNAKRGKSGIGSGAGTRENESTRCMDRVALSDDEARRNTTPGRRCNRGGSGTAENGTATCTARNGYVVKRRRKRHRSATVAGTKTAGDGAAVAPPCWEQHGEETKIAPRRTDRIAALDGVSRYGGGHGGRRKAAAGPRRSRDKRSQSTRKPRAVKQGVRAVRKPKQRRDRAEAEP